MRRRELWLLWVFPAIQLLVYLVIFQLTPQPLEWHLGSALPRLLFHISPIVVLAASWLVLECQVATWPARVVASEKASERVEPRGNESV